MTVTLPPPVTNTVPVAVQAVGVPLTGLGADPVTAPLAPDPWVRKAPPPRRMLLALTVEQVGLVTLTIVPTGGLPPELALVALTMVEVLT